MEAPLQLLGEQHLHHLQDMQQQQLSERHLLGAVRGAAAGSSAEKI